MIYINLLITKPLHEPVVKTIVEKGPGPAAIKTWKGKEVGNKRMNKEKE